VPTKVDIYVFIINFSNRSKTLGSYDSLIKTQIRRPSSSVYYLSLQVLQKTESMF